MVQSIFSWFEFTLFSGIFYLTGVNFAAYDFGTFFLIWKLISGVAVIGFVIGIVYSVMRTQEVYRAYMNSIGPKDYSSSSATRAAAALSGPSQKNIEAWVKLRAKASSDDENERKIGIIAADSLIDKILERAGYKGENLGARLMQIEPSDLDSLQDVWEGHKVRNRIAHEAFYKVERTDAIRTLDRFEKLLKELRYL